jgi:hypothetical protein
VYMFPSCLTQHLVISLHFDFAMQTTFGLSCAIRGICPSPI